jgi:hypothetical protein
MSALSQPPPRPLTAEGWPSNEDYLFAFDLYNAAYFWEAHVYWEKLWALEREASAARALLRGLIQLAAAGLKERDGARKLVERSRASLSELPPGRFRYGVDVESVRGNLDRGELPARLELIFETP